MDFIEVIMPILPVCGLLILVMIIGVAFNTLWLKLMLRNIRACPECGAKSAGEIVDTQEIPISNHVDHRGRKPVRIKEVKIIDHYECMVCKHTWERSFTRKERIRMNDIIYK
jgi:hypothetical protein